MDNKSMDTRSWCIHVSVNLLNNILQKMYLHSVSAGNRSNAKRRAARRNEKENANTRMMPRRRKKRKQ